MSAAARDKIADRTGLVFQLYTLNRRWSNASLMKHRAFDGHIVSMQQSGSHWIKNMLAGVLSQLYGLPPLAHIQDDSIIGHTKSPPVYKNIPQIVHSHGYPHALTLGLPGLHYPKYLVLVRDLRASLVSHYERFRGDYAGADFSAYLRGDVRQKTYHSDIWSRMRFMNEWGRVLERHPDRTLLLRYEDMKADAPGALRRACAFFGIAGAEGAIDNAVAAATRDRMAEKPNPAVTTTVVRPEPRASLDDYFTPQNQAFFEDTVRRYLKYDMGYNYLAAEAKRA
jgi:hypothetical protein